MQLFALSNKVSHVNGSRSAAKYPDGVKESRKSKDSLRFGQSPAEDCLQHDAADKSDKGERLSDTGQQLRAVEILCCPGAGVLRIQPGSEGCTSKADGEEETGIEFVQQQKCSGKRHRYQRNSTPDNRRPNLTGFKSAYGERLWNKNNRCAQSEAEPEEQCAQQQGVPFPKIR